MNAGLSAKELHSIALQHARNVPLCMSKAGKRAEIKAMLEAHREAFRKSADKRVTR